MKFDQEKKMSILLYILEKIDQKTKNLSRHVADALNVNQNTVHRYINELTEENIIKRVKRGEYALEKKTAQYRLSRKKGELSSETRIFKECVAPLLQHLQQNVRSIWEYAASEMLNNVIDHSCAEDVILYIEQDYLKTRLTVLDNGVGIFEKIKTYFELDSLEDAICELFKGKLTTDSANHSGEGIFFSSKIMDEFLIVSGQKVFTTNKYEESYIMDLMNLTGSGTAVYMALSNHTKREPYEVFDLYSNVDGGFTKTTIPLKNIFDTAPVSRSQARRVLNRLDKFKEVVLNFEGLDWMGQGFAHQIFRVFQEQNPQIKIVPVHMNEAISKMYRHVLDGE